MSDHPLSDQTVSDHTVSDPAAPDPRSDPAMREQLLARFAAYLDDLEGSAAAAGNGADGDESADLFAVFVELAGVRTEVRTQSRIVKEALDRFRAVFDTLSASHATLEQELKQARAQAHDRERAVLKPLLLEIIEVRDRLAAGLTPPAAPPPRRWYRRLGGGDAAPAAAAAWQEGTRMTLRRLDRVLFDRRVVAIETVGRPLDPRHAVAVATRADTAAADGHVVEELRPGFVWNGELLRPAEVIVARRDGPTGEA